MAAFAKCKPIYSNLSTEDPSWDGYDDDGVPFMIKEIEELGEKIIAHNCPGAKMIVNNMQSIDYALATLHASLSEFNPDKHHEYYVADLATRRYIYLKSSLDLEFIDYIVSEIKRRIEGFHVTHTDTQLAPKPNWAAAAEAWKNRHQDEMAREARRDRSAQRRILARKRAAAASSTRVIKPRRMTTASARS